MKCHADENKFIIEKTLLKEKFQISMKNPFIREFRANLIYLQVVQF